MATEKAKVEQPTSVEERLKNLYELQTILSQIDRLKTIRGELPLEVKDLEDGLKGLETRIENYSHDIDDLRKKIAEENAKIYYSQDKIIEIEEQIKNISNNHEFDLLNKELVYRKLEIEAATKHRKDYEEKIKAKEDEIAATEKSVEDKKHILEEKDKELNEIISETKNDEERLEEKANEIKPKIDARTLNAFNRIRKSARNGLGIVYIQREACGGCFNRIPPQKQMEIKMHKKIIVCEYCGRIMIDPALAGVAAEEVAK